MTRPGKEPDLRAPHGSVWPAETCGEQSQHDKSANKRNFGHCTGWLVNPVARWSPKSYFSIIQTLYFVP